MEKEIKTEWLHELHQLNVHEMRHPIFTLRDVFERNSPASIKDRLWDWYVHAVSDTMIVDNPIVLIDFQKQMETLIELSWLLDRMNNCGIRDYMCSENEMEEMQTPSYWPRHRLEASDFAMPLSYVSDTFFGFFELGDCREMLGKWLGCAVSSSSVSGNEIGDSAFFLDILLRLVDVLYIIKKRAIDDFLAYKNQFI